MKILITIARLLVGSLYVFSGLVKAIDPLGLAYKMQEFFEAWSASGFLPKLMSMLHTQALFFSVVMIALEIVLGLALLIGWKKNFTLSLLLILTLFFTFLTAYVLFSGKIRACGCFGDCIPLTPMQTFTKDLVLLALVLLLIGGRKHVVPVFGGMMGGLVMLASLFGVTFLQFYVLKHLPFRDCLPYKVGNNILELRKMPTNAIPDQYDYVFVYEKEGVKKDFTMKNLPDSTWKFADRKQILIKAGSNNIPAINDFALVDSAGVDVTETVLNTSGTFYLFFVQNLNDGNNRWSGNFASLYKAAVATNKPIYVVTSDPGAVNNFFNVTNQYQLPILTSDATAIKTAARATPVLFVMQGPVVMGKYSWADLDKAPR